MQCVNFTFKFYIALSSKQPLNFFTSTLTHPNLYSIIQHRCVPNEVKCFKRKRPLCMRATKQDIFGLGIILNCNMSCLIYLFHLFFYLVKQCVCVCVYSAKAFSDFFVHFDSFSFVSWFFLKLFYHIWLTKSKCFLFFYLLFNFHIIIGCSFILSIISLSSNNNSG